MTGTLNTGRNIGHWQGNIGHRQKNWTLSGTLNTGRNIEHRHIELWQQCRGSGMLSKQHLAAQLNLQVCPQKTNYPLQTIKYIIIIKIFNNDRSTEHWQQH
jgi:hypothetical protein